MVSQGPSGRIVVEIDPSRKRELYARLEVDGLTLKEWLLRHIEAYLGEPAQVPMFTGPSSASPESVNQ
jgi:hypothetical protein